MPDNCGCIWVGDYDTPQFHSERQVKARKAHKCGECGRDIPPGETYEYVAGSWDGRFDTYKTCKDCLSVRESFFCDGWLYEGIWEQLWEHIYDHGGDIESSCLEPLTPRARGRVCEMIEEAWPEEDNGD